MDTRTHKHRLLYGQIRRRYNNNIVVESHTRTGGRARATMTRTKIISAERRPVFAVWESICACGRRRLCTRLWPMSNRTQYPIVNTAHNTTHYTTQRYTYYGTVVFIVAARKTNGRHVYVCIPHGQDGLFDFARSFRSVHRVAERDTRDRG